MSVTVSASPIMLLFAAVQGASAIAEMIGQNVRDNVNGVLDGVNATGDNTIHLEDEVIEKLFNKEYETMIMDKSTLIKTLTEHGAVNISQDEEDITCDCEEFTLSFTKENKETPYKLNVSYNTTRKPDNLIENIAGEYASNAQEISYNKIKERLEKNNLEIEDEEIFDDNTIVLTVNLD